MPAVATAVGGVPELVRPGITGLLVPPSDAAAFASALARLLADRAAARAMGDAARLHALANHSLTGQVDALLALWRDILDGAACIATLLWLALGNGYPLLHFDTGTYLRTAVDRLDAPVDRPLV